MNLLYGDFYGKYVKHLPIKKLEKLEMLGLGTQNFPYDGYLLIKLAFNGSVIGQMTFKTSSS